VNQLLDDAKPDLAFITETWLTEQNKTIKLSQINPEYQIASSERTNKKGGGTLILIKESFSNNIKLIPTPVYKPPPWLADEKENGKVEITITKIKPKRLPREYSSIIAICVYVPEFSANKHTNAIYQLTQVIEQVATNSTQNNQPLLIIAGDFNGADVGPIKRAFNLHQINKKPTRANRTLDIIITNAPKCYESTNRIALGESDHDIVLAKPSPYLYKQSRPKATKIMVKKGKIEDTIAQIRRTSWDSVIPFDSRNFLFGKGQVAFDSFYTILQEAEAMHQPTKAAKIKGDKPWMTPDIKQLIQKRQRLFYIGKPAEREWKQICTAIKAKSKVRKRAFNQQYTTGDTDWWKEVKQINSPRVNKQIDPELATQINEGFYQVWNGVKQPDLSEFVTKPDTNTPTIFNYTNVRNTLNKLKKSASGPDELSAKLLKSASLEIVEILTTLFNQSLLFSFVPKQWKYSNITPIPKVAIPSNPLDYRPVALTAILCKVFERILAKYILDLTAHLWRDNKQFGFLPGRSTMDAIAQVIEDWSKAKETKQAILAIFFDFAKAFDLVPHDKLLIKLRKYLPPWLISWIAAYLSDRKQRVVFNQTKTDWKPVEAGVIQGSVLGPILFLLFIHDINEVIPEGIELEKYADDILAYIIGNTEHIHGSLPQKTIEAINSWCTVNGMRLNTTKCKVMTIGNGTIINPMQNQYTSTTTHSNRLTLTNIFALKSTRNWDRQWQLVQRKTSTVPYLIKRL
jgi:hypothetical protein